MAQLVGASSHTPKGQWFHSWSVHITSVVGLIPSWGECWRQLMNVSLSLFLPLSLLLKSINMILKIKKSVFYTYSTSPFGWVTFLVFSIHTRLMAIVLYMVACLFTVLMVSFDEHKFLIYFSPIYPPFPWWLELFVYWEIFPYHKIWRIFSSQKLYCSNLHI